MNNFVIDHAGLFEGIGGFSYAANAVGWDTGMWCEINPFGQRVLKYYHPNAVGHSDITKTDFKPYANKVRLLTGGFPCQPYSTAGQRLGTADSRHLWPEMLRAVREIQPLWVVGENVRGLINWNGGLVFDQVQTDLENEGYEVIPFLLPACAINAPHRRDRIWFIAYSNSQRRVQSINGQQSEQHNPNGAAGGITANTNCGGQPQREQARNKSIQKEGGTGLDTGTEYISGIGAVANTNTKGLQRGKFIETFNPGNARQQTSGPVTKLHKIENWSEFPTFAPVCSGNDGIPRKLFGITFPAWRRESIKAYGNAIVPQVAIQIFKAIQEYEKIYL